MNARDLFNFHLKPYFNNKPVVSYPSTWEEGLIVPSLRKSCSTNGPNPQELESKKRDEENKRKELEYKREELALREQELTLRLKEFRQKQVLNYILHIRNGMVFAAVTIAGFGLWRKCQLEHDKNHIAQNLQTELTNQEVEKLKNQILKLEALVKERSKNTLLVSPVAYFNAQRIAAHTRPGQPLTRKPKI